MRVKITDENDAVTWLAGDPAQGNRAHSEVNQFAVNGVPLLQPQGYLRASEIELFDRGNKRTVITFDTTRRHDDKKAAALFALMHAADLPATGLFTFQQYDDAGGLVERYMDGAIVSSDVRYKGKTTYASYSLLGGKMRQTP